MAVIRKKEVKFETSATKIGNAKKGEGWIRKTYKFIYFKACDDCSEPFIGSKSICTKCEEKRAEELRWVDCSCGERFRLEDHQNRQTRVCPICKEEDYHLFFDQIINYFNTKPYSRFKTEDEKMYKFASKERNIVQSVTGYSNFKMMYEFENVDWKVDNTWEHINSMTFLIYNFLKKCHENPKLRNYEYARNYLLKYGVQFRTSAKQNQDLVQFQTNGVTPEEYISVVGNIRGKTKEETINIIKKHFINHG